MSSRISSAARIVGVLPLLVLLVGCQTMSPPTTAAYVDDRAITNAVRATLASDPTLTRVGVITQSGVVNLTGTVDSPDRAARATQLAQQVTGVRQVVNQVHVASTAPPAVTVITPPISSAASVSAPPSASAVIPGHPPIDIRGTVAAYDPQTMIVTLQDGRMVRIRPGMVWQPASTDLIQPGKQIYAQGAEPVGIQAVNTTSATGWRMGIVDRVDTANGLVYLADGSVAPVAPSTRITLNGRPIALAHVQPGAQIAVRMPLTTTAQQGSAAGGYALPRAALAPSPASTEILVFP